MTYRRGAGGTKPIEFYLSYYIDLAGTRIVLEDPDLSKPELIIDELHNLRFHYERQGLWLKRIDTKRRYYKRVRHDAPFASELPKKINGWVDSLRKVGKPAKVIDFPSVTAQKPIAKDSKSLIS